MKLKFGNIWPNQKDIKIERGITETKGSKEEKDKNPLDLQWLSVPTVASLEIRMYHKNALRWVSKTDTV